jgi:hypothetical protein
MKQRMRAMFYEGDVKRLRLSCRCGNTWVEEIPGEIYEAHFISPIFECSKCNQEYYLLDKHVRRTETDPEAQPMREYIYDGQARQNGKFDA